MKNYLGIDNGLDGGLAALSQDGQLIDVRPMPTIKLGKGREIDTHAVNDWLAKHLSSHSFAKPPVIIEAASKHSPGTLALCSTWQSFGILKTVVTLNRFPLHIVEPKRWQKAFWTATKTPKGSPKVKFDTKAAALLAARRIWPSESWLATDRSSKPHDGMVDAALIAEWARRSSI